MTPYFAWLGEDAGSSYTSLMGATTYRLFAGFVESGEEDMSGLTALDKVVFSSSLEDPLSWANTRLVSGDPVEAVRRMKQDGDAAMRTIGGPSPSVGRSSSQVWWTGSESLCFQSSTVRPDSSTSTPGGPMLPSRRSTTAPSTGDCR